MHELVISHAGIDTISIPLPLGTTTFGRSIDCDFCIPDVSVSSLQFQISVSGEEMYLESLSSTNTTKLNDKDTSAKSLLKTSDKLQFGVFSARVREITEMETAAITAVGGGRTSKLESSSASPGILLSCDRSENHIVYKLLGDSVDIGSDPRNQLVINDDYVSAFHCKAYINKDFWYVKDLDSTNGTFVNGVMVKEARLEPGTCLSLGNTNLHVHLERKEDLRYPGLEGFITKDPVTLRTIDMVRHVAATDDTVLVTGESGCGKELLSRAIHRLSNRSCKKLVTINCATISNQLASELFGHEKGAFTGAVNQRKGLFEEANGGTLFLDEIADMSPEIQASVLRAIEYGEIRRVGANTSVKVDVRLIAATNKNLSKLVGEGSFREDLYYRICVHEIEVPPLRQRPADVRLLADYFLERYTKNTRQITLSRSALDKLHSHDFPGNVRELGHLISRAIFSCSSRNSTEILTDDLVFRTHQKKDQKSECDSSQADASNLSSIHNAELSSIKRALNTTNGNRARAAKILGIARTTLISRMKKYGLWGN